MSRPLRVGIDGRQASRGLGIAQFTTNLVEQLASHVEVVWFGDPLLAPSAVADVQPLTRLPYPLLDSSLGRVIARRSHLDVFHFTANTGWTRSGPVPFVLTVHDLIFLDTSIRGHSPRQVFGHRYLRWNVPRAARHAAAVVTVSQTSLDEIRRHLPDITVTGVIPNAPDLRPGEDLHDDGFDSALVFSAPDPRKGVEVAYRAWVAAGRVPPRLHVLAGHGVPKGFHTLAAGDLRAGRVLISPYVDRQALHHALRSAGVLIYPSTHEGFGLPVLEAMAAGTPVISGLAPATLEVGGDAVARIDPKDPVGSIASLLQRMRVDKEWRAELRLAGLHRARGYSWTQAAEKYLTVYESVLSREDAGHVARTT